MIGEPAATQKGPVSGAILTPHEVTKHPAAKPDASTYFLPRPKLSKRLLKRDRRPPRSSNCCWPPVQAGCDLESMSSCITSPSLPQVERVANSVPSVMTTLMEW